MFLRKLALGIVILLVVAAAYWASLLHSLGGLEAGLRDRNVVKLEKYVDWARIREQIRSEIKSATTAHLVQEATRGDGVRVPVERDHGFRWKMITQSGAT